MDQGDRRAFLRTLILLALVSAASAHAAGSDTAVFDVHPESGGPVETITTRYDFTADGVVYTSTAEAPNQTEAVRLRTGPRGDFLDAVRTVTRSDGRIARIHLLADDDGRAILLRKEGQERDKILRVPDGHRPAVGPSFLVWLRLNDLPPGSDEPLFLVSFSGQSIRARARHEGIESVSTPLGTFVCRRIRVTLDVPLWRPHMDFWLADDTRRLVRHRGRRGFLSRIYVSELRAAKDEAP